MAQYRERQRWSAWHVVSAVLVMLALVVGLVLVYRLTDGSQGGSPPSQIAAGPTPTPLPTVASASPPSTPQPVPSEPAASAPARSEPPAPAPTPEPSVVTWSALEQSIAEGIRSDARVSCSPRRRDLPPGAVAGVECAPGRAPVDRVGFYWFETSTAAWNAYDRRLAEEGIPLNSNGPRGWETSYIPCGPDEDPVTCGVRHAGYVNSAGFANYRTVIGRTYVGVLGTGSEIDPLVSWAFLGSQDTPGSPTIFDEGAMAP